LGTATPTSLAISLRSQAKTAVFLVFFAATIFAAYERNSRIFDPTSPIAQHYAPAKWFLPIHALFGTLAISVAAFQFSNRLRARHLQLHRVLGNIRTLDDSLLCEFGGRHLNNYGAKFGSPPIFVSLLEWADLVIIE
jgi:hypothetical protein